MIHAVNSFYFQLMLVPVDVISGQYCSLGDIFPWLHDYAVAFIFLGARN